MGQNIVQKIIQAHLVSGEMTPGKEIAIKIDRTLTQDATGTMAYLQFEAIGIPKVKTEHSVSYVDHNTLQTGFENADDHRFLRTIAAKYGIHFSRPGNGICHQVNIERFAVPGKTLLGSDSHTPTGGGACMIAIGAGGLDVAVAMGGGPFYLNMPKVVLVRLTGKLGPWVSGKDVILELLRRLTVKGGVGKMFEYGGPGVKTLSVPERATITNMGAELGATTSIFPSDERTLQFMKAQKRAKLWTRIEADGDATYDETIDIDLSKLVPLIAMPHMPDRVVKVTDKAVAGLPVHQVCIGSCTNGSYRDLMTVAAILKGKTVTPGTDLIVSPGSKQVFKMIADSGALASIIAAGARIAESACGFCIGMGHSPNSGGVSLRTNNRNFEGRSGTKDAQIYLCSVEVAAAAALTGKIADPRRLGKPPKVAMPKNFYVDDSGVLPPARNPEKVSVERGPNIKPLPAFKPMPESLAATILLKVGDNITTDHISPAGAKFLPLRSNIPAISQYVYGSVDPTFAKRALDTGGGFIAGGENYGQGSSREHAALAPRYLGVKIVMVKSFARIHLANLINFGICPLIFKSKEDYEKIAHGAKVVFPDIRAALADGTEVKAVIESGEEIMFTYPLTERQRKIVMAGGLLSYTKQMLSA